MTMENGNHHTNTLPENGTVLEGKMVDCLDCEMTELSETEHQNAKKKQSLVSSWWKSFSHNAPDGMCGIWGTGSKYILKSKESKFRRFGWVCIIMFSMSALIVQIADSTVHFSTFPLSVDISVDQNTASVTFPKVVICNLNTYVKSKTQALPVFDKLLRNYENIRYRPNDTLPLTEEDMLDIRAMDMANVTIALAHEKENMFLRATFAGSPLDVDDIVPVFTGAGLCYQINHGLDGRQLLKYQGGGKSAGLRLILNTEQEEYYYNSNEAGFIIQLLDQEETPLILELGFDVGPGRSTSVALTAIKHFNEKPPYGVCGERKLKYFEEYSRMKCYAECMTDKVMAECGCRTPYQPGNATVCDPITIGNCTQPIVDSLRKDYSQVCQCPLQCSDKKFSTSLSSSKYPSKFRARLFEQYLEEGVIKYPNLKAVNSSVIEENFAKVNIFFLSSTTPVVTQQAAYPFFALLSDIGGAMGLWLGSSLLSLYELLDVCGNSCSRRH